MEVIKTFGFASSKDTDKFASFAHKRDEKWYSLYYSIM